MTTTIGPGLGSGPLGVQPWGGGVPAGIPLPGGTGWYRVSLDVGAHSYSTAYGDPTGAGTDPDYGVRLPLTLGWQIPETAGYPAQADPTRMTFNLLTADAAELADIAKGTDVSFTMWTDPTPGADPWQTFSGVVTQVDGRITDAGNFRLQVYAGDNSMRLADVLIGYTTPWPQETILDRLARIATEAGITISFLSTPDSAVGAELPARSGTVTALAALRDALADLAGKDDSEGPTYYAKWVPQVDTAGNVTLYPFQRRRYPDSTLTLTGANVSAFGDWSKLPAHPAAAWVIVDDGVFGTPAGPPLVRRTQLVPGAGAYGDAIDNLGKSLLPDGSTQLDGWFAQQVTWLSYRDPSPMGPYLLGGEGLPSMYPPRFVVPVEVTPLDPAYELNGVDYLAGTLTGAQLIIPPGGKHRVTLTLRPELLA